MPVGLSDSAIHACSGAAGGIVSMAITYPLVNLSTRAQVAARQEAQSMRKAAIKLIKQDGISGLYDGLTSSLLGVAVTNGIYYLFFEETRSTILRHKKSGSKVALSTLESMLASALAGAMTAICSNPIWVVNTRQTVRTTVAADDVEAGLGRPVVVEKKLNVLQTILHILRTDGVSAFFHGLGPALILVSNPILQFTLFEQLKNFILARRARRGAKAPLTDLDFFLLGAVSKLFATGVTYPYLTVKARMQAGQGDGRSYKSTFDGLKKILRTEGATGLYKGVGPKLTQSVATAAILFLAKEKIYQATVKALKTAAIV